MLLGKISKKNSTVAHVISPDQTGPKVWESVDLLLRDPNVAEVIVFYADSLLDGYLIARDGVFDKADRESKIEERRKNWLKENVGPIDEIARKHEGKKCKVVLWSDYLSEESQQFAEAKQIAKDLYIEDVEYSKKITDNKKYFLKKWRIFQGSGKPSFQEPQRILALKTHSLKETAFNIVINTKFAYQSHLGELNPALIVSRKKILIDSLALDVRQPFIEIKDSVKVRSKKNFYRQDAKQEKIDLPIGASNLFYALHDASYIGSNDEADLSEDKEDPDSEVSNCSDTDLNMSSSSRRSSTSSRSEESEDGDNEVRVNWVSELDTQQQDLSREASEKETNKLDFKQETLEVDNMAQPGAKKSSSGSHAHTIEVIHPTGLQFRFSAGSPQAGQMVINLIDQLDEREKKRRKRIAAGEEAAKQQGDRKKESPPSPLRDQGPGGRYQAPPQESKGLNAQISSPGIAALSLSRNSSGSPASGSPLGLPSSLLAGVSAKSTTVGSPGASAFPALDAPSASAEGGPSAAAHENLPYLALTPSPRRGSSGSQTSSSSDGSNPSSQDPSSQDTDGDHNMSAAVPSQPPAAPAAHRMSAPDSPWNKGR